MAGPNLEVFKFGVYMFFPVWVMFKFGDPDWYNDYVLPYKNMLWPPYESTHRPPKTASELQEELARLKAERAAKRAQLPPSEHTPTTSTTETPIQGYTSRSYYRARAAAEAAASGHDMPQTDNAAPSPFSSTPDASAPPSATSERLV